MSTAAKDYHPTNMSGQYRLRRTAIASQTNARYKPSSVDFIHSFYAVLRRWQSETSIFSDPTVITSHPSYEAIVNMGSKVVPLIIGELNLESSLVVFTLEDITGEKPYSREEVGDIKAMANAWLLWAERDGVRIG